MNRYSLLIKCMKCGKNFKVKKERGTTKYVCSGYDRFGKDFCKREVLTEAILDDPIELHFKKNLNDKEIRQEVKLIEVFYDKWIIKYCNGSETIISDKFYQV